MLATAQVDELPAVRLLLPAREIAEKAMKIAGEICIYTNDHVTIEELKA
jgi:ATP-dependent protease HslVU (ClpYQ) peptidase subunit